MNNNNNDNKNNNININKIFSLLSLCQKAGKLLSGEFSVENSLQQSSSFLVIIAGDASDNTKKKFQNKAHFYNVNCVVFSQKHIISSFIGKCNRSVFSITDEGFAQKIFNDISLLQS